MENMTCGEYAVAMCQQFMAFIPPGVELGFEDFVTYAKDNHPDFLEEILPEKPELSTERVRKEDMTEELMEEWAELAIQSLSADLIAQSEEHRDKYITSFLRKAWDEALADVPPLHDLHLGGEA